MKLMMHGMTVQNAVLFTKLVLLHPHTCKIRFNQSETLSNIGIYLKGCSRVWIVQFPSKQTHIIRSASFFGRWRLLLSLKLALAAFDFFLPGSEEHETLIIVFRLIFDWWRSINCHLSIAQGARFNMCLEKKMINITWLRNIKVWFRTPFYHHSEQITKFYF